MDEAVGTQVEEAGVETGEALSTEATETTGEETTEVSTDLVAELDPANLETLRTKYGETMPEGVQFFENIMGDYTRKTQGVAAERQMTQALQNSIMEHTSGLEKELRELKEGLMPTGQEDFSQMNEGQLMKYLEDKNKENMRLEIDSRIGPLQDQLSFSQMEKEITGVFTGDDFMQANESTVRQNAAVLANSGMNASTVMSAAAYGLLKQKYDSLVSRTQGTKRTAAKQASMTSGSDAGTKPVEESKMTSAEILADAKRRMLAGEFGPI